MPKVDLALDKNALLLQFAHQVSAVDQAAVVQAQVQAQDQAQDQLEALVLLKHEQYDWSCYETHN